VIACQISLVVGVLVLAQAPEGVGSIEGRVVNATRSETPVGAAEVMLQVRLDGKFMVVARTTANGDGRFRFEGLPVDQGLVYLPGANSDGIHYPGPRLLLSPDKPSARVELKVRQTISEPNPLVIREYDIAVRPERGALRVSERMLIENPEPATYIGQTPPGGAEPVTLRLAIPGDFERVTFDEEFYGRGFSLINEQLVTGIPWTPGRRELKFTYVVRNDGRRRDWSRPLDLPCERLRVTVNSDAADGVSCNLGSPSRGRNGAVMFESNDRELPAGYTLRVELSRLSFPMMAYARWVVLGVLIIVVAVTYVVTRRRGRADDQRAIPRPLHRKRKSARATKP
jgi:hypothetical protein